MRLCPAHLELTGLVAAMQGTGCARGMTDDEACASAVNLAVAGYLSTTFLIATGTLNLLQQQGAWQMLSENPDRLPMALEELLRFDAPAQLVDRYAAVDMELGGVVLKEGDLVTAVLGSANHDDDTFPNPDVLDLARNPVGHFTFGDGIHVCLGAPLARTVAPIAFKALLAAYPRLHLAGMPQWQTDPYLRSVSSLPVAIA
jgi:cytochrome P450